MAIFIPNGVVSTSQVGSVGGEISDRTPGNRAISCGQGQIEVGSRPGFDIEKWY